MQRFRTWSRALVRVVLGCSAFATLGCGVAFDPPTEIKSLRVFGVQKDLPYARPGETVSLTLSWHDGSPKVDPAHPEKRTVRLAWFGPCVNPPFDSYASCGQAIERQQSNCREGEDVCDPAVNPDTSDDLVTGVGPKFELTVPNRSDTLHGNQDPKQPPYGLVYVFFAACAGELGPSQDPTFPAGCYAKDDTSFENPLGSDDFVAGYTAIYVFGDDYRNENPVINGFVVNGKYDEEDVCIGDSCLGTCTDDGCVNRPPDVDWNDRDAVNGYCEKHPTYCIPTCADDGDPLECPGYDVHPGVDTAASSEPDQITNENYGHSYVEQMWIDYYSTRGALKSPTKLLQDATAGWNGGYGTEFYAPDTAGPVQLWAAVHDNRGGVAWAGITLVVR